MVNLGQGRHDGAISGIAKTKREIAILEKIAIGRIKAPNSKQRFLANRHVRTDQLHGQFCREIGPEWAISERLLIMGLGR